MALWPYIMSEVVIAAEFKVIRPVARGRSAQVSEGVSLKSGRTFAIKLQPLGEGDSVLREASILRSIQEDFQFAVDYGLPLCHVAGRE